MEKKFEAVYRAVFEIDIIMSNPWDSENDPLPPAEHTLGSESTPRPLQTYSHVADPDAQWGT